MGKFYVHKDGQLRWTGVCQDGLEELQATPGYEAGAGDPPPELTVDTTQREMTYDVRRRSEYPPIGDQLDALWSILGPGLPPQSPAGSVFDVIQSVKRKHPKP